MKIGAGDGRKIHSTNHLNKINNLTQFLAKIQAEMCGLFVWVRFQRVAYSFDNNQQKRLEMNKDMIFSVILVILIAAGILNFFDHRKNQIKAEAMTTISWVLLFFAGVGCVIGFILK